MTGQVELEAIPLNYWIFLLWMIITSIGFIIGTIYMHLRSSLQPVKARDRVLATLTNLGYILGTGLRCIITFRPELPCLIDLWQTPIGLGFLSSIFLLRSWRMYFKFELAHERSLLRSGESQPEKRRHSVSVSIPAGGKLSTWYSDHRYLISDKFTVAFTIVSLLIFFVPTLAVSSNGTLNDLRAGDKSCQASSFYRLWETGFGVANLVGLLVFAIKLRKTFDAFGIKNELIAVFWLNILSWASTTILSITVPDGFNEHTFAVRKIVPLFFFVLLYIQTTAIPLYRTFQESKTGVIILSSGKANDINTLTGLLNSTDGFAAFQQYLIGCFCVESCLFWKEIESYRAQVTASLKAATQSKQKSLSDIATLLARTKDINTVFIQEESRLQVNISASQRQRVEHAVQNLIDKYENSPAEEVGPETVQDKYLAPNTEAGPRGSILSLLDPRGSESVSMSPRGSVVEGGEDVGQTSAAEDSINPQLREKYKDILNVFNIAQLEVIELMRTDPYPRFRVTKQYQDLIRQAELQQHQINALRDLNVI